MTTKTSPLLGPLRKRESHLWARHEEDWYCEPSWVSERLFQLERFDGRIWDPACGGGNIVESAEKWGLDAVGSDKVDRANGRFEVKDFLEPGTSAWRPNIVSNPPFGIAEKFVARALNVATCKVAMLLPSKWIQGDKRSRWLETTPFYRVWFITPRPSMPPGEVLAAGGKPGNGTTDYAWFVWLKGFDGDATVGWLRKNDQRSHTPLV
jgi:hypothetical protein